MHVINNDHKQIFKFTTCSMKAGIILDGSLYLLCINGQQTCKRLSYSKLMF